MKEHNLVTEFKGHKVRDRFKVVLRMYDNPIFPWTFIIYDEVFKRMQTIHKDDVYDYVFGYVFPKRRLFTTGSELENLFNRVPYHKDRHLLKAPNVIDNVCFLSEDISNPDWEDITTLSSSVARKIDWMQPHTCFVTTDNVTNSIKTLSIVVPEANSVVLANPKFFEVKEKLR